MKFGEWTKISEQLPPEPMNSLGRTYIVTVDDNQVVIARYVKTNARGKDVIRWEYNGRISSWNILAWMPLPEPYNNKE